MVLYNVQIALTCGERKKNKLDSTSRHRHQSEDFSLAVFLPLYILHSAGMDRQMPALPSLDQPEQVYNFSHFFSKKFIIFIPS
jgi:hypothetical protein